MCRCVSEILRRSARAAALAVVLLGATPSQAGVVFDFDLSGSALRLGSVVNVADGMGATVSGRARIELTGVDGRGMLVAPTAQGTLSGLDLTFNLDTPILAGLDANLVGPVRITQIGMASGAFDGVTLQANGFNGTLSLNLGCAGSACPLLVTAGLAVFPIVQNVSFSNLISAGLSGLGSGKATLVTTISGMNSGVAFTVSVRGQAPEPLEAGLMVLGLLALCGSAAARLRQA